jgi:hypothetical protein
MDTFTLDYAGRDLLDLTALIGLDFALTVQRPA